MSTKNETKPANARNTGAVSSREHEREVARKADDAGNDVNDNAAGPTDELVTDDGIFGKPDYYRLSYLKQAGADLPWDEHKEVWPTHDEATTRSLALNAAGATCLRITQQYWH